MRKKILLGLIPLPLLGLYIFGSKMSQDQAYHTFADLRYLLGVNNFHNVTSNLPFTIFSLLGLNDYFRNRQKYSLSWLVFLLGVFLVAPGSAYYHYATSDSTLVWDRLPMTIAFMGLTAVAMREVFAIKKEGLLLGGLIALGIYSVIHWVVFDDLRVYAWVQITPIVSLLYISLAIPTRSLRAGHLVLAVALYVVAKMCEGHDETIFRVLGYSGHSLKHIVAGFSVYTLILMKQTATQSNPEVSDGISTYHGESHQS